MALEVFNATLQDGRHAMADYSWADELTVAEWRRGAQGRSTRVSIDTYSRRRWTWPQGLTEAQLVLWLAFFEARAWTRDAFLLRDPRDERRQLSLGNGNGVLTTFPMTTTETDPDYRFFPLATTVDALVNGLPTACTVDQDARTVTFAAPPAAVPLVLRYDPLRLVRLAASPDVESMDPAWVRYSLELEELVRD